MNSPPVEMTVVDGLRAMREVIADPDHWTQRALARDKWGHLISPEDPAACQWCLQGAFYKTAAAWSVLEALEDQLLAEGWAPDVASKSPVATFNDAHTHPEALALLDRTIAAREEQAA